MPYFNTITIDGKTYYRANEFTPAREYVYAGEIVTCTGKTIADLVGWKYSDLSLEWDSLPQEQLENLLALNGTEVTMTFTDVDGHTASEQVIPLTHSMTATRFYNGGNPVWKDVSTNLRFLNVHNY